MNKIPWYKQSVTLDEAFSKQRAPVVVGLMLLDCAFFLFRLLSPHHLGDHNGSPNWFGVIGSAFAAVLAGVMPSFMRWCARHQPKPPPA